MEKLIYFFIHLAIPTLILILAIRSKPKSKLFILLNALTYLSLLYFLYLWGQWPLVGSFYIRYVLVVIAVVVTMKSLQNYRSVERITPNKKLKLLYLIPEGFLVVLFIVLASNATTGLNHSDYGYELFFPLKNGKYYVASGGSDKSINNHMRDYPNSQQYALDINKLGVTGGAFQSALKNENDNHYIFDEEVFCPCSGSIEEVENFVDDNEGVNMNVSNENGRGNFVTVKCGDLFVSVYHLKKGSVVVTVGEVIREGQLLGKVGNSGFSQEPHLHIQAAIFDSDSSLVGVPMKFNNEYLVRNDVISN